MRKLITLLSICLFAGPLAHAQTGGDDTYAFLRLTSAARVASLGGNLIAVRDDDINLAQYNPSIIDSSMTTMLALSYINYFSDINYGYASYGRHIEGVGTFVGTLNYLDYGEFILADEAGTQLGTFSAGDYALTVGYGRPIDSMWSVGANFKMIFSSLEQYNSFGVAADVAGTYHNAKRRLTLAMVMKNMGAQIKPYLSGQREPLPFEIQLGLTKQLKHAPLRIGIMWENFQKWDLTAPDDGSGPEIDPLTGLPIEETSFVFGDKLMRHIILNGEILLTKNFNIRLGYNYRRRQELKLESKAGTVGISWGFGFRIKKFDLSYGRAAYHRAGASNHFTLGMRLSEFRSRR